MDGPKILLYVDPQSRSEWALTLTEDLARGLGAQVVLLTTDENLREHENLLDRAAERFSSRSGVKAIKRTRPGPARRAILDESRESHPAITVFAPAGRRGLARIIKGSRVKTVLHNAPSTVMIARKPASQRLKRILVTISGGPFSQTTLLSAHEIAQALGAELSVLHVASSVHLPFHETIRGTSPPKTVSGQPAMVQEAPREHDIRDEMTRLGINANLRIRHGLVVREILAECREGDHDLLILGQHLANKESGGPLSEDIAEILAVESPRPVIIVRPRRWAAELDKDAEAG